MAQTLFEQAGGFAQVRKIVSAFYDRVLETPSLQPYFANVRMPRLIDHQTQFITYAMGGPARVADETLRRAHAPLGVTQADFETLVAVLRETLLDADLDPADVESVLREVRKREGLIVSKGD